MLVMFIVVAFIVSISIAATRRHHPKYPVSKNSFTRPTLLLVSMDGFRHDYFDIAKTPNMNRLKTMGVYAKKTMPIFPSKTFPNHYTIVTGLYAESHGIVSNYFYDPEKHQAFHIKDSNGWWGGEPIWVTAKNQGHKSGTYFWPGSESLIEDTLPNYYEHYNESTPWEDRVETVMAWFDTNSSAQAQVATLYFEEPDWSGHHFGASSQNVITKIELLDNMVGELMERIFSIPGAEEHFHLILTTDHGMANITHYIYVDDYINVTSSEFFIQEYYPLLQIWPINASDDAPILDQLYSSLSAASPNMTCYLRHQNIPERFHYTNNDRIAPLLCVVDEGFEVRTHQHTDNLIATHGYDNALEDMAGFFIGIGRKFRFNTVIEEMPDVDVYNIMCSILDLKPSPNNGTLELQTYLVE
jgi:predicted AlkP superfamily pyrophosphatase or phosphodiesterase